MPALTFVDGAAFAGVDGTPLDTLRVFTYPTVGTSTYASIVVADSPVAYWPFNGSITPTVGPAFTTDGRISATYVPAPRGIGGLGLQFKPGDYLANSSTQLRMDSGSQVSLEAWIRHPRSQLTGTTETIYKWSARGIGLQLLSNGTFRFYFINSSAVQRNVDYSAVFPDYATDGAWHHLVGTFDGVDLNLWIDGQMVASATYVENISWQAGSATIGASLTRTETFRGDIASVAAYAAVLTDDQIVDHYMAGVRDLSDVGDDPSSTRLYTPTIDGPDRVGFTPISAPLDTSEAPNATITVTALGAGSGDEITTVTVLDDDTMIAVYPDAPNMHLRLIPFTGDVPSFLTTHTFTLESLSSGAISSGGAFIVRLSSTEVAVAWRKNFTHNVVSFFTVDAALDTVTFTESIVYSSSRFPNDQQQSDWIQALDSDTILMLFDAYSTAPHVTAELLIREGATPTWTRYGPFAAGSDEAARWAHGTGAIVVDNDTVLLFALTAPAVTLTEFEDLPAVSFITLHVDREQHAVTTMHELSRQITRVSTVEPYAYVEYGNLTSLDNRDFHFSGLSVPDDFVGFDQPMRHSFILHVDDDGIISVVRGEEYSEVYETGNRTTVGFGSRHLLELTDVQVFADGEYTTGQNHYSLITVAADGALRRWNYAPIGEPHDLTYPWPTRRMGDRSVIVSNRYKDDFAVSDFLFVVVSDA
jgi:hypothetical protein